MKKTRKTGVLGALACLATATAAFAAWVTVIEREGPGTGGNAFYAEANPVTGYTGVSWNGPSSATVTSLTCGWKDDSSQHHEHPAPVTGITTKAFSVTWDDNVWQKGRVWIYVDGQTQDAYAYLSN